MKGPLPPDRQFAETYAAAIVTFLVSGQPQQVRHNGCEWEFAGLEKCIRPDDIALYVGKGRDLPKVWPGIADPNSPHFNAELLRRRLVEALLGGTWSAHAAVGPLKGSVHGSH